MSNRDVAVKYLDHFCKGDVQGVEATLAKGFHLKGPLFEFESRGAYIASLSDNPLEPATYRILAVTEGDETVSVYYTYDKPSGSNIIAQLFRLLIRFRVA